MLERELLLDVQKNRLGGWAILAVGAGLGGLVTWTAAIYFNERNDMAMHQRYGGLQEALAREVNKTTSLEAKAAGLQKENDELRKLVMARPNCDALRQLIADKRAEIGHQEQQARLTAPVMAFSISEDGKSEDSPPSKTSERAQAELAALRNQLRELETRNADCASRSG